MKEYVLCELCKVNDAKPAFKINSFSVVQCNRCGLFYVNPRLSSEEVKEVYSENYWTGRSECGDKVGYIKQLSARERAFRKYLKHISAYKKSGRILDVGCGVGIFLKVAKEAGYETYGLEISEFASNFARDNFGLNVFTGALTEARFQEEFFDIITMFDVFSHLPDPLSCFLEANRILDEAGVFIFATGNYSLLPDSLFKERWGRPEEHYWKLNNKSLKTVLSKSGFQLIKSKVIGSVIPISPKKLNQIGVPNKVISFLVRMPLPILSDEVIFICKKHNR